MADKRDDPVVVIGLGRFGTALALELSGSGTEVLAIDSRPKVVQALSGSLTHIATADATDAEALRQLGVPDFERAVVAIGGDLEASILTASQLVDLEIPHVWAKAVSREHARILERIGVHHVVQPEADMGERVAHLISGRVLDYVQVDKDFVLVTTRPPKELVGRPLGETGLRKKHGVTVVCVKGTGGSFTYASPETVLQYGDIIIVAGPVEKAEKFAEWAD